MGGGSRETRTYKGPCLPCLLTTAIQARGALALVSPPGEEEGTGEVASRCMGLKQEGSGGLPMGGRTWKSHTLPSDLVLQ